MDFTVVVNNFKGEYEGCGSHQIELTLNCDSAQAALKGISDEELCSEVKRRGLYVD